MNEVNLESLENVEENLQGNALDSQDDSVDSQDNLGFYFSSVSGGDVLLVPDGENGELRLLMGAEAVSYSSELEERSYSGNPGYQVQDYILNYFKGILRTLGDVDYCLFSTRQGTGYNYQQYYYLYVSKDSSDGVIQSGVYTRYQLIYSDGIYYSSVGDDYLSSIPSGVMVYSNQKGYSDIREGGSYGQIMAVLFFLAFFAIYAVCHDLFDYVINRIYRR